VQAQALIWTLLIVTTVVAAFVIYRLNSRHF